MKVLSQQYGKARLRLLKVFRNGPEHELCEIEVSVLLEGGFDASFTNADNRLVVATDTMKNIVQVMAKEQLGAEIEPFGIALGNRFIARYPQVTKASVRLVEHRWQRLSIGGQPHSHGFVEAGRARPFAEVISARTATTVASGLEELRLLKSTGSGFADFARDEFTTLPETQDRILATTLQATWHWSDAPAHYRKTNEHLLEAMLERFAVPHSPSVQATLYWMAEAALAAVPEISRINLALPNQHCLLAHLAPFGLENPNELFIPTDEPHGQIEATISR